MKVGDNIFFVGLNFHLMGGFQRAIRGKNKKYWKTLLAFKPERAAKSENLRKTYVLSEMANFDYNFCFV